MTLEEFKKIYSANIKNFRAKSGLRQEALAEKIDLTEKYISDIETGRILGSLATLVALANALGVEPHELILPPDSGRQFNETRTKKLMSALRENLCATLDTIENFLSES